MDMDPITTAAVAGLTAIAADAAKEGATHLAKLAWGKIKGVMGWKDDPAPAEIGASAARALTERPELAEQVERIVADYRQPVDGVSTGSITAKTSIVGQNNTFNGPTTFN